MSTIYGIYRNRIILKPELLELWESARSAKARVERMEKEDCLDVSIVEMELHHAYKSNTSPKKQATKLCVNSNPTLPLAAA